jgi:hypothetical protein
MWLHLFCDLKKILLFLLVHLQLAPARENKNKILFRKGSPAAHFENGMRSGRLIRGPPEPAGVAYGASSLHRKRDLVWKLKRPNKRKETYE